MSQPITSRKEGLLKPWRNFIASFPCHLGYDAKKKSIEKKFLVWVQPAAALSICLSQGLLQEVSPKAARPELAGAHIKLSGFCKEEDAMILLALSCCEVPVPSLMMEFGYIPAKHHFPAQLWQPEQGTCLYFLNPSETVTPEKDAQQIDEMH
ncbi:hypothetical protein AV530_007356 [Patagioenas fasciata monilis]|uniref:Uncharacterized protein n=1 Tax=Patagioenas fasciata monilis TaxID=372326 RepID=A0A1V4JZ29_PATFA|nr:hypothetical protein AV530_007356 [Patagioenas fasciata monilis]